MRVVENVQFAKRRKYLRNDKGRWFGPRDGSRCSFRGRYHVRSYELSKWKAAGLIFTCLEAYTVIYSDITLFIQSPILSL